MAECFIGGGRIINRLDIPFTTVAKSYGEHGIDYDSYDMWLWVLEDADFFEKLCEYMDNNAFSAIKTVGAAYGLCAWSYYNNKPLFTYADGSYLKLTRDSNDPKGFTCTNYFYNRASGKDLYHGIKLYSNGDSNVDADAQSPSQYSSFYRLGELPTNLSPFKELAIADGYAESHPCLQVRVAGTSTATSVPTKSGVSPFTLVMQNK